MELTIRSMAYLSDALNTGMTHIEIERICAKIGVDSSFAADENGGISDKTNRLWFLIKNLNQTDTLNELIKVIITEHGGDRRLNDINAALQMSNYTATPDGQIMSRLAEETDVQQKLSEIEKGLINLGFNDILAIFQQGVVDYGEGNNFQDIRRALEGLVKRIINKEGGNLVDNMRANMETLFEYAVLKTCSRPFSGTQMEKELVHSYGIYSLLSEYIDHYNPGVEEIDRHFVFFQSVGLIWLIVKRYLSLDIIK